MARCCPRVGERVDGLDHVVRVDDLEQRTTREGLAVVDQTGGVPTGVDDDTVVIEEGHRFGEVLQEGLRHPRRGPGAPLPRERSQSILPRPAPVPNARFPQRLCFQRRRAARRSRPCRPLLGRVGWTGARRCARLSIGRLLPALLVLAT